MLVHSISCRKISLAKSISALDILSMFYNSTGDSVIKIYVSISFLQPPVEFFFTLIQALANSFQKALIPFSDGLLKARSSSVHYWLPQLVSYVLEFVVKHLICSTKSRSRYLFLLFNKTHWNLVAIILVAIILLLFFTILWDSWAYMGSSHLGSLW